MSGAVEGVALLPCPSPWCKSGVPPMPFINRDSSVAVICGCDFHGPAMASRDEAIAAWNTRTTPPARFYADGVEHVEQAIVLLTPPGNVWTGCEPAWQSGAYGLLNAAIRLLSPSDDRAWQPPIWEKDNG